MTVLDLTNLQLIRRKLAEAIAPVDVTITDAPGVNLAFYRGNHLQDGDQWGGPLPDTQDTTEGLNIIRRVFTSQNMIAEVSDRKRDAIIGQEPSWSVTVKRSLGKVKVPKPQLPAMALQVPQQTQEPAPVSATGESPQAIPVPPPPTEEEFEEIDEEPTPEEQSRIEEAEAALVAWWDRRKGHRTFQDALTTLNLAGRSVLRSYVPPGLAQPGLDGLLRAARVVGADTSGNPILQPPQTLDEALDYIYLQHPALDQACVYVDPDTQMEVGIYISTDPDTNKETVEICYVQDGITVLGQFTDDETLALYPRGDTAQTSLSGHLLMHQMDAPPLITEQVRSLQRTLNEALTLLRRNAHVNALGEITYVDVEPPTGNTYIPDPVTGQMVLALDKMGVGAGARNFLMTASLKTTGGALVTDSTGKVQFMPSPQIHVREPTDPLVLIANRDAAREALLGEVRQLHTLMSADATASGKSRVEARADFGNSLRDTAAQVNAAGRVVLEAVMHEGALFWGQPGRYDDLRINFECRIDTGPLTPEERNAIIQEQAAGLESAEGAMMRLGRTDPKATLAQVDQDKTKAAERQQETFGGAMLAFDRGQEV